MLAKGVKSYSYPFGIASEWGHGIHTFIDSAVICFVAYDYPLTHYVRDAFWGGDETYYNDFFNLCGTTGR